MSHLGASLSATVPAASLSASALGALRGRGRPRVVAEATARCAGTGLRRIAGRPPPADAGVHRARKWPQLHPLPFQRPRTSHPTPPLPYFSLELLPGSPISDCCGGRDRGGMGTPATSGPAPAPLLSESHKFFHLQACLLLAPPAPTPLHAPFLPLSQADTQSRRIGTRNIYLRVWGLSNAPADPSCSLMYSGHWARPWDIAGGGPRGSKQGSVA